MKIPAVTVGQDDAIIDRKLGLLLRTGVMISAVVVLIGGVLFLLRSGSRVPDYHVFRGVPANLTAFKPILADVFHGNALAIIQLGLLLLIATPVARVAFSVFAFAMAKDVLYVGISAFVLCVLLCGILWG
jgi:uncharacterized membrane protein